MEYNPDSDDKKTILIVDHDTEYAQNLADYLISNNFIVEVETESASAISRIHDEQPDLVVIEVELQNESGLTICKLCRKDFAGGIVMMSHRTDDLDQVIGLDMGADDYLSRQTSPRLFLARLQAVLRRTSLPAVQNTHHSTERLEFGPLVIDNTKREAWLNQQTIDLTSAEFDLLWLLSSNAGEVLTREDIFRRLRGIEYDGQDRSVDVRVSRIRPKVGDDPEHPRRIKTVRSKGYLFVSDID